MGFFSKVDFDKCFAWAYSLKSSICNYYFTVNEEAFFTKFGERLCVKDED